MTTTLKTFKVNPGPAIKFVAPLNKKGGHKILASVKTPGVAWVASAALDHAMAHQQMLEQALSGVSVVFDATGDGFITLNYDAMMKRIREGVPVSSFERLTQKLGVSQEDLAKRMGTSVTTLFRLKQLGRLDPDRSDKLMRFERLFVLALALFEGNEEQARNWLTRPAKALNGERPLDVASTEAGAREVENLIGRLENGVYS